jgi:myo-inositol-1(or 4)-monophosphatase
MQEKQSELLEFAIKLAKESGQMLLKRQPTARILKYKGESGDFQLDADIQSEENILRKIRQKYPNHDILTEETGHHHKTSDYLWIIDPLEGTVNYAHKLPLWGVNIGLFYKNAPFIGVFYTPMLKEIYYAEKGKGAYLNGKRIHVNKHTDIMKTLCAISLPGMEKVRISSALLRATNCCGIEMAFLACGRFGARIKMRGTDPYGYGAGSILVLEAGGKITDMKGKPWHLKSDGVLASNGKLHDKLLKILDNTS